MVCIPCIVIPFFLWIFHRFIRPVISKIWNPWRTEKRISEGGSASKDDDHQDDVSSTKSNQTTTTTGTTGTTTTQASSNGIHATVRNGDLTEQFTNNPVGNKKTD